VLYLTRGQPEAALAQFDSDNIVARAAIYHALGRHAESDRLLAQVITEAGETDGAGVIAWIYAVRGEPDSALMWLDRAYQRKDEFLLSVRGDPIFEKALAHDPRYQEFIRKMNFPK
jgi:hypothetical protein